MHVHRLQLHLPVFVWLVENHWHLCALAYVAYMPYKAIQFSIMPCKGKQLFVNITTASILPFCFHMKRLIFSISTETKTNQATTTTKPSSLCLLFINRMGFYYSINFCCVSWTLQLIFANFTSSCFTSTAKSTIHSRQHSSVDRSTGFQFQRCVRAYWI